jgi:hypothetical protein
MAAIDQRRRISLRSLTIVVRAGEGCSRLLDMYACQQYTLVWIRLLGLALRRVPEGGLERPNGLVAPTKEVRPSLRRSPAGDAG